MKLLSIKHLIILGMVLFLSNCFKHTYHIGAGAPDGEVVYNHWHHHWLFGLIGDESLDQVIELQKICPSGNATIHEEVSFLNGLVDILIGVIYSPTTVTVRCEEGDGMARIELTPEQVQQIIYSPEFLAAVADKCPNRFSEVALAQGRSPSSCVQWARLNVNSN